MTTRCLLEAYEEHGYLDVANNQDEEVGYLDVDGEQGHTHSDEETGYMDVNDEADEYGDEYLDM